MNSFIGLYGIYFSLQYLSLSDATVLTFLSPMFTAVAGAVFLKEHLTLKQVLAGCTYPLLRNIGPLVISLDSCQSGWRCAHCTAAFHLWLS